MRLKQTSATRVTHVLYLGHDEQIYREISDCVADFADLSLSYDPDPETILADSYRGAAPIILLDFDQVLQQSAETFDVLRQRLPDQHLILLADDLTLSRAAYLAEEHGLDYIAKSQITPEILRRAIRYGLDRQRLRTELAFIHQIGHHLVSTVDLKEVQAIALEEVRSLLDVMACSIWLLDEETGELVCQQIAGPGSERIRGWRLQPGQGIVGWVAQFGEALLIPDTWRDPRHYTQIDQSTGLPIRSTLCLPLKTKQKNLGALQLVDKEVGKFSASDLLLLEPVAATTAIAIENAQLFYLAQQEIADRERAEAALRDRNWELDRLYRASDALLASTSPDMTRLAESIVQTVQKEFAKTNCSLVLLNPETHKLNRVAAIGPYTAAVKQSQLSLTGKGFIPEVIRSGHISNCGDVKSHPAYTPGWLLANSELTIPLKIDGRVIGALDLQSADHHAFNADDERLLSYFADRAALALQNARLFNETQRWAKELDLLNHIVSTITAGVSKTEIFETACTDLAHFLNMPYVFVAILAADGRFQTIVTETIPSASPSQIDVQLPTSPNGMFQSVLETNTPFVSSAFDLCASTELEPLLAVFTAVSGPVSLLVVPIAIRGKVAAGSLILVADAPDAVTANTASLVKVVGEELGRALENILLSDQLKAYAAELEARVAQRTSDLRIANTQLVQALQSRDEFLASMSHELRTPLNAILLRCELIHEVSNPTAELARSLNGIEESAQHLLELINDILDVAKIEAGKLELILEAVDVNSVCVSSIQMVRHLAEEKQIQIVEGFGETAVRLNVDGRRLKQILVNLLSNALKFTPEGGMIGLEVLSDADKKLAHFVVWDNGIGIAAEDMTKLFKPFVQLDSSLARKYPGTGLGLALVQRLVSMHQGTIQLESTPGLGSRFIVTLPWSPSEGEVVRGELIAAGIPVALEENSLLVTPTADVNTATILLAEDNETTIEVLGEFLAMQGYEVILARNGLEAVELAGQEQPDLILMDIQMPGLDGLEAIRRIRAELLDLPTEIVAMTALVRSGDRERCLAAGANGYISKPISFKDLNRIIQKHVSTKI